MKGSTNTERRVEEESSELTEQHVVKLTQDTWNLFLQGIDLRLQ